GFEVSKDWYCSQCSLFASHLQLKMLSLDCGFACHVLVLQQCFTTNGEELLSIWNGELWMNCFLP
ncbi:hypothetical protein ACQP3D_31030, partial [Escherichia coli]